MLPGGMKDAQVISKIFVLSKAITVEYICHKKTAAFN